MRVATALFQKVFPGQHSDAIVTEISGLLVNLSPREAVISSGEAVISSGKGGPRGFCPFGRQNEAAAKGLEVRSQNQRSR